MASRKLNVVTPGEEPATETAADQTDAAAAEGLAASPSEEGVASATAAPTASFADLRKRVRSAAKPKDETSDIDESEVDPAKIPYGQTLLTKQGRVCSTAPDPKAR